MGDKSSNELMMDTDIIEELESCITIIPLQNNNQSYEELITIQMTESGDIVDAKSTKLYNVILNFKDFLIALIPTIVDPIFSELDEGKIAKIVFKILEAIGKHNKVKIDVYHTKVVLALAILSIEHRIVTNDMVIEYLDSFEPQKVLDSLDVLVSIKCMTRNPEGILDLVEEINILIINSEN
jgi:hypothetical protein